MKRWESPKTVVQKFEANEYVAACFNVQCVIGQGNEKYSTPVRGQHNTYVWNGKLGEYRGLRYRGDQDGWHGSPCGYHMQVRDDGTVFEEGKGSEGWIADFVDTNNDGKVSVGENVYWITIDSNGGRYHHFGTAYAAVAGNPNLS